MVFFDQGQCSDEVIKSLRRTAMTIIEEECFARKFMMHFEGIYSVLFDRTWISDHRVYTVIYQ